MESKALRGFKRMTSCSTNAALKLQVSSLTEGVFMLCM